MCVKCGPHRLACLLYLGFSARASCVGHVVLPIDPWQQALLGPVLEFGLSRRYQRLRLAHLRSPLRLFLECLEAAAGLCGVREGLLCLAYMPTNGQRVALDDVMDDMEGKRSRGKLIENQWVNFLGFTHRFY